MQEIINQLERERDEHYHKAAQINNALEHLKKIDNQKEENSVFKRNTVPVTLIAMDIQKKKEKKVGKEKKEGKSKYTPEIKKYIENNLHMNNEELAEALNKRFNLESLSVQMAKNGINRKENTSEIAKKEGKRKKKPEGMTNKEINKSLKDMHADDPDDDPTELFDEGEE